jgi:hypothetical protein
MPRAHGRSRGALPSNALPLNQGVGWGGTTFERVPGTTRWNLGFGTRETIADGEYVPWPTRARADRMARRASLATGLDMEIFERPTGVWAHRRAR